MHRHEGLDWEKIEQKLKAKPEKLCSLNEMERTEGEPDVVGYDEQADQYIFCDMGMYSSITMEPILTTPQEVFAVC